MFDENSSSRARGLRIVAPDPLLFRDALLFRMLRHALFGLRDHRAEGFCGRMERLSSATDSKDTHGLQRITLLYAHDYIEPFHHLAEHRKVAIEIRPVAQRNAKLRGVGVRARVRHVQSSRVIVTQSAWISLGNMYPVLRARSDLGMPV